MKTSLTALLPGLALILIAVSRCTQSNEKTAIPSSTLSKLVTRTQTSTASFTPSPTDTITSVPVSTLPIDQAQTRLLELLSNNANCHLPCLWGITPGESTFEDARDILSPLSGLAYAVHLDGPTVRDIDIPYTDGSLEIYTRVAFLADPVSNIVYRVGFNTEAHRLIETGGYEDLFDSEFFSAKISAYTLPNILSELGVPESVMISTFGGPLTRGGLGGFDLLLTYSQQGMLIKYTTQMHLDGTTVLGCFTHAHVHMDIRSSGEPASFDDGNYYQPLEEVTTLSTEEFYEAYRLPTDMCIETPAEVWPTQEP